MSQTDGQKIVAIPGPSPVPDRVLRAAHRPSPDIYGDELAAINLDLLARLKWLAGTSAGHVVPYIGNGHAGWEAVNNNLFQRGDRVLLLVSGFFGRHWGDLMTAQGLDVQRLEFGPAAPDPARLAEALAADRDRRIRAVMVCHIDTASSVQADIPAIRAAMTDHPALLVVDAIASLGCAPMQMDDWGVDVLISASQKGLMCPPGTCFLWASQRAAAQPATDWTTPYWDWRGRIKAQALWEYWGGTPPVQQIFALSEALSMMQEDGLEAIYARHDRQARAVWTAFEGWGAKNPAITLMVTQPRARARSVTGVHFPGADALRSWLSTQSGVTIGIGLGAEDPTNALRLAHMGYCGDATILAVLGAIQAGMRALSIPHDRDGLDQATACFANPAQT